MHISELSFDNYNNDNVEGKKANRENNKIPDKKNVVDGIAPTAKYWQPQVAN